MSSVNYILQMVLKRPFLHGFINDLQTTMRLPGENLDLFITFLELRVPLCFYLNGNRFRVQIADMKGLFSSRRNKYLSEVQDHRPNWYIFELA